MFGSFSGSQIDSISLENGSLHIELPIVGVPGRNGNGVTYRFTYNQPAWTLRTTQGGSGANSILVAPVFDTATDWSLRDGLFWDLTWVKDLAQCGPEYDQLGNLIGYATNHDFFHEFALIDPNGTKHPLAIHWEAYTPPNTPGCPGFGTVASGYTLDGTGLFVNTNWDQSLPATVTLTKVISKDGSQTTLNRRDPNGNLVSSSSDTLARTVLSVVNGPLTTYTSPLGQTISAFSYTLYNTKDSSGTQRSFRMDFQYIDVQTNYCGGAPNCQEDRSPRLVPRKLTLPNGLAYTFTYANAGYADLLRIDLPSGGSVGYTYSHVSCCMTTSTNFQGFEVDTYSVNSVVTSRTVTNTDGTNASWTYSMPYGAGAQTTVVDPFGTKEDHYFAYLVAGPAYTTSSVPYETDVRISDSGGRLLHSVHKDYAFETGYSDNSPNAVSEVVNARVIRETTTLDNGSVAKKETDYETIAATSSYPAVTFLNPTETREYDYGSGAPGPILRRTDYTYLHQSNSAYRNLNILDLTTSAIMYDGAGTIKSQTQYEYDIYNHAGMPAFASSGAVQHDSSFGTSYLTRGNVTAVKRWRNTDGAWLTTTNQYDDAGNLIASKDPSGNLTQFDYTDSWSNAACAPGGQGKAYLTKTTNALNQTTTSTYNSCPGSLASAADLNNLVTAHSYEMMNRRIQSNFPDQGQATACFSDVSGSTCYSASLPLTTTQTQKINSTLTKILKTVFDGLGRPIQTQLTSDPQGTVYVDTTYDALGRVHSVSNPYRAGADATSSPGITTYAYDALSRKISETYPDGSMLTTAYCGASTLVTDPTGKWRRSRTDGLGRLIEVDEPNAVGATVTPNGCPSSGEPIWVTSYGYDTLGNLTSVMQNGSHSRTFTYDSLSHLLTSTNPEVSTITYTYDANGNVATKTDARNITITYGYDALNRETGRTYSNSEPSIAFRYDEPNCLGLSSCSNIGHRTSMTDDAASGLSGSEAWAYQVDATNHRSIQADQRTTVGNGTRINTLGLIQKTATYYRDLAGNIFQAIYPTGRTVNYSFDGANRPSTAVDGSNGITYATDFQTPPASCLTGVVCYTPQGTFYALSIGQSSTFTGLNLKHTYNTRLQPNEFSASSSAGNAIDISYNFVDPVSTHNAGHIYGIINNLDSTRSQTFTYDQLNRITGAQTTSIFATSPGHCWSEVYTVDPWANLQSIAATTNSAYTGCTQESGFTRTPDASNHLAGLSYDAAGNTTNDGVNSYTWNAEGQLVVGASTIYRYSGDGLRLSKGTNTSTSRIYWYGPSGEILAETDGRGSNFVDYIYFGGQRIASTSASNSPYYYVEDLLGTSRVLADSGGNVCYDADFYPFGGERQPYVNNFCNPKYKFEGKERDAETGNDDFGARYYSNRFGRFMSPDPLLNSGRPWAPQTWNRYAFARNNPLVLVDPSGLYDWAANAGGSATDDELRQRSTDKDLSRKERNAARDALKFRDKFRGALAAATAAATGSDKAALVAYGTEGDHNKVNVGIEFSHEGHGASTVLNNDDSFTVTFGNHIGATELAVVAAHEGEHVADGQAWVAAEHAALGSLDLNHYGRETRAWEVSGRIAQVLGMSHYGPHGAGSDYYVWNSSWHGVDRVAAAAQRIVRDLYHQTPGDTDTYSSEHRHDYHGWHSCDCH